MGGVTLGAVPSSTKLGIPQRFDSSKYDNYDSKSEAQATEGQRNSVGGDMAREVPARQGNSLYRPKSAALKQVFRG